MGRVAKYKKVKSCDPYSKKNGGKIDLSAVGVWGLGDNGRKMKKRSLNAQRMRAKKDKNKKRSKTNNMHDDGWFDVPPTEADEFEISNLTGSVKRQTVETDSILGVSWSATSNATANTNSTNNNSNAEVVSTGNFANIPKTEQDENKVTRLLRLDKQEQQKLEKEKHANHARMEGESKRAYAKRTKAETRQIIKQSTTRKNPEKLQRKKDFMKNKKKNKKRKGGTYSSFEEDDIVRDDDDYEYDVNGRGSNERPPIFRQTPRGGKSKSKTASQMINKTAEKSKGMSDAQIEAEMGAMEIMRRRVQAQYAAIKSKRKHDFHL